MLNGKLSLHDIDDVAAYCGNILNEKRHVLEATFAKAGRQFNYQDAENYLAFLIERCWERSQTGEWHSSFSGWVGAQLRSYDTPQFLRDELGRTVWKFKTHTYERPRPVVVGLEDSELESAITDIEDVGVVDLVRALRTGHSKTARGDRLNGKGVDGRAQGRDRGSTNGMNEADAA